MPNADFNRRIRDSVDALLSEAGYAPDSSARHQLSCMNFDEVKEPSKPYAWHYLTISGGSIFYKDESARLQADLDAAHQYPNAHLVVPLYRAEDLPAPPQKEASNSSPDARDKLAAKAMSKMLSSDRTCSWTWQMIAQEAYKMADEMSKARNK